MKYPDGATEIFKRENNNGTVQVTVTHSNGTYKTITKENNNGIVQYAVKHSNGLAWTIKTNHGPWAIHLHHVVPYNELEKAIMATQGMPLDERRETFNEYINLPHVRPFVEAAMAKRDAQISTNEEANDSLILQASVAWNINNPY